MSGIMQMVANNVAPAVSASIQLLYLDAGNTASYSGSGTTWTDLSTYQNDATLTNSPTWTNAGTASYFSFNGTNQFAPVTASKMNVAYTGKTTMFAIRTVNANTGNAIYRCLFGGGHEGGGNGARNFNTYMYHVSGSTWQMQFSTGPSFTWAGPASASFTVTDNQWVIVAVTQTTDGVLTYYVNGQQIGTPATGVTFSQYLDSNNTEAVARADNYWNGDMGVCAVYGSALSASQIQSNYTTLAAQYGIVTNNLVLYYDPDNSASYSGSGTTVNSLVSPNLPGTMSNITFTDPYFTYNGTSSTVSVADTAALEPGSGDFTLEAWVYYSVLAGSTRTFVSKTNNGGGAADWSYGFRTNGTTGGTYFEIGNGTTSVISPSFTVSTGQWYQIVGVWTNVASNSIALYVNGAGQGSNSHSFASVKNSTNPLYLGSYNGGEFSQWFNGRMGIVRYYNTALTAAQVLQNYNANRGIYGL
jgi:hypothetical protein